MIKQQIKNRRTDREWMRKEKRESVSVRYCLLES